MSAAAAHPPSPPPRGAAGNRPSSETEKLEEIYAPIRDELEALREFLQVQFRSDEPFICRLLSHIETYRGKQIRPALLLLVGKFFGRGVGPDHVKIAGVIELIHTATLVHDDILDDAALRRNVETVHRRWGERAGVLLGDFLYSRAFALSTEVPGMAAILSATTNTICEGELLQVENRFRPDIGEDVYLRIIRKKTAVLHAVACSLGAVLSGAGEAEARSLHDFGLDLGTAFQIVDDCLDYSGDEASAGKSLGTDLHQGKVTLPLLCLLKGLGPKDGEKLIDALRRPLPADLEVKIAGDVRERGALREALDRARGFIESARSRIAGTDPALRKVLEGVADYVLSRKR
jgi:octaprenyl-diphosphate synthase